MVYLVAFSIVAAIALICIITAFVCFMRVFYYKKPAPLRENEYAIPEGEIYEPFREEMTGWMKSLRSMKCEHFHIRSFDGLTLSGRYYEYEKGAPIEIMLHGYQGNAERDLCGGVFRCFDLKHNALIVDNRACGESDGKVISFGINEMKDCISWIDFALTRFGNETRLILTGISMGAATVMMATGEKLPQNVKYVLADCGYSSAKEIIKKVIDEMGLPAGLLYPFVRLGAFLFGRFRLEKNSPIEAVKRSCVPVIFFHGDNDAFVPCEMSEMLYRACKSEKMLVVVPGAGHGLAYPIDKEGYLKALSSFDEKYI